tara:strand:+ start:3732 stop:3968 length:237 start_codon:yes stop_codon:yes gene_type:complete
MKITIDVLKKLIKEEFKLREAKEEDRKNITDMPQERQFAAAEALDVLENAAEEAQDPEEVRWYITKVGEAFGLEPDEE